jgi:hypothetical protein
MNKMKTKGVTAVIMAIFVLSFFCYPTPLTISRAVVQDRPVVLIDKGNTDVSANPSSYTLFHDALVKWGYEVRYVTTNYTAADFVGVDILVLSKRSMNMTGTAKTAMTDWFDSGNKSILMGGDGHPLMILFRILAVALIV